MKQLLLLYLNKFWNNDSESSELTIESYQTDGSICTVNYKWNLEESSKQMNINIWEILDFILENKVLND